MFLSFSSHSLLTPLFAALLGIMLATTTRAETTKPDLYRDVMQSISDGRKMDASDTLIRMIEQEPQHAGAWLDLALIQCELGRAEEAERLFRAIESRFAPPQAILDVITRQRQQGCSGWQARHQWFISLTRGTDSNVNQGASSPNFNIGKSDNFTTLQLLPEYLPNPDQYITLSADYSRDLNPNGSRGFIQFQQRSNDALSRYDTKSISIGTDYPWRAGTWSMKGTAALGLLELGGQLYQKQAQLQFRITPTISMSDSLNYQLMAGISHVNYTTLVNFDANIAEIRGTLSYRIPQSQTLLDLGFLKDCATEKRPGGSRQGVLAGIQHRTQLGNNLIGELGWSGQLWQGQSPYSPGLIQEVRHQHTQIFKAGLIFPLTNNQSLQLEWRRVINNENISIFEYNGRQFQLTWQLRSF